MEQELKDLDPKMFGLTPRTCLKQDAEERIIIVLNRKSRVIMKDAKTILEKVKKIQAVQPDVKVLFQTCAPVCSKSVAFLKENQVELVFHPLDICTKT